VTYNINPEALAKLSEQIVADEVDDSPRVRAFRAISPVGLIPNSDLYEFWIDVWVNAEKAHSGSLDAAARLHKTLLPGWDWSVTSHDTATVWPRARVENEGWIEGTWPGEPPNPARAWLLAILAALMKHEGEHEAAS
jgi:hypothetical protein